MTSDSPVTQAPQPARDVSEGSLVVDRVLARVRAELGMDIAYLTEVEADSHTIRHLTHADAALGLVPGAKAPLANTYCDAVVRAGLPVLLTDTEQDARVRELPPTRAGIRAYVGVPVECPDGSLYGTLCCASSSARRDLAERDIAFMHVLGRMIGDVIHREREQMARERMLEGTVVDQSAELRVVTARLTSSEAELVQRLSMAVEYRDDDTGAHVERVGRRSATLAGAAGLDTATCDLVRRASPLHDVGKVALPDAVLLKPGRLTPEERATVETHAERGYDLLKGSASPVLRMAATIAWTHHERYDGGGYPRGLTGEAAPIAGRIVAIVDVFDALTSDRVYRPALSLSDAIETMREGRGTQFDPYLLDLFLAEVALS